MSNKNKKILYISDESRKREYNKKSLAELKRIIKKKEVCLMWISIKKPIKIF